MADSKLLVFSADGSTAAIDIRTESTNGDGRQVFVMGDPAINSNVAAVQGSDPSSNVQGIVVRDINTSAIVGKLTSGVPITGLVNISSTASIFTISGSTSGVSVSGVNLVAPSASYSYKVFAYSIQTTGIVSVLPKFVNGAGGGQTEFWRPLATANQTASTPIGANLAVPPPGFIFATGVNTSLNLLLDTGTLVHYSVSYIKESA